MGILRRLLVEERRHGDSLEVSTGKKEAWRLLGGLDWKKVGMETPWRFLPEERRL